MAHPKIRQRIILTGPPGSGKSSLLEALNQKGYSTFEEISRKIIRKEQASRSSYTPWQDVHRFCLNVFYHMKKEIQESLFIPLAFHDRGIPDLYALLDKSGYMLPRVMKNYPNHFVYSREVFVFPPWREIYTHDPQRKESFQES
ncbi:MAG: AAA family ATPase, partial [Cytophagales bacterium]|nr:AAA family ATPase [Cytophagales bacterium]